MNIDPSKLYVPASFVVAVVVAVFGALEFGDGRWALAGEVKALSAKIDGIREQELENKIFELDTIPDNKRTAEQEALLKRYRAQLEALRQARDKK